jgi:hypothetical protein
MSSSPLLLIFTVFILVLASASLAQSSQSLKPPPIPLGRAPSPPPPLTNLPPFVSIYDPVLVPSATTTAPPVAPDPPLAFTITEAAGIKVEPAPVPVVAPSAAPAKPVLRVSPPPPPLSPEERNARIAVLKKIIPAANIEAERYNKLFRDLSAEETRISERFNEKGEIKQTRKVVCELVVYQSRLSERMAYEYRNAKSIDGKSQKLDEKRIEKFFQKLLKADSINAELNLINQEGLQHDLSLGSSFYGLTLHQWREIEPWALADVGFQVTGREILNGSETVVVAYQQTRPNERLKWYMPLSLGFASVEQNVRGHLWLDSNSLQIRQAEREMWVTVSNAQAPIRIWRQTMQYKPSPYGIWVPQKFVSEFFYHIERNKEGFLTVSQTGRLTSEYGEFKRFDVTSEEQEKKTILKAPSSKPRP